MVQDASPYSEDVPRNPHLLKVHDTMLDGLGQLADYFGFPKIMGQLYGSLLLSAAPLSLDDLMARLNISKASVSMNIRTLEHLGMVRQVWVKGSSGRRKYYEAETNYWQVITNVLAGREMRDVERAIHVMEENSQHLAKEMQSMTGAEQDAARHYIERMAQLQLLFQFARLMISNILAQSQGIEGMGENGNNL